MAEPQSSGLQRHNAHKEALHQLAWDFRSAMADKGNPGAELYSRPHAMFYGWSWPCGEAEDYPHPSLIVKSELVAQDEQNSGLPSSSFYYFCPRHFRVAWLEDLIRQHDLPVVIPAILRD